jgi:outer membrane protein
MKVAINQKEELYFNQGTAHKINFMAPFKVLFTATIVNRDTITSENTYSLQEIIQKGLEENLDIKISHKDLELSDQEISNAYSNFLPTASLSANAVLIDEKLANPAIGQAEKSMSASGTVQQLIYSEEAIANIKIQKLLEKAQTFSTRQTVQDVVLDIYASYFIILQGKTNLAIQRENLALSKKNLELSKLRLRVGAASNADVYRWESEVANVTQALIEAQSNLLLSKFKLNSQLNGILPEMFDIKDARIEDDVFSEFSSSTFGKFVQRPNDLRLITQFLIAEALRIHPSKRQLLANLDVVERQLTMRKRAYYLPTLALQGQRDETLWRGGKASDPLPGQSFNNSSWNVALNLSYPLFDGNRRHINLQKSIIQRDQVNLQLKDVDNALDLNIKAKALQLLTAMTNIDFAKISAENAAKSFELVQNAYKQGANTLTQLLDAQKAALQAKLAHSNSVFNYLMSFLELEGSVGYLHVLATEQEKENFKERLNLFIMEQ